MTHENDRQLRLVRGYLLNTLSHAEREEVDRHLAQSAEWREAMVRQRRALEVLDALPADTPPPGLAAATVAATEERLREDALKRAARRQHWGQTIFALCVVAVIGAILIPALERPREASRRASDQNNLKQLGIVFKMYASETPDERYPPMAPYPDVWMFDLRTVYPEYMTDLSVLVNPDLPDADQLVEQLNDLLSQEPRDWEAITRIAARSYTYTAWGILDASELTALVDARRAAVPSQLDANIDVDGKSFYRLRKGVERFFITDINGPASTEYMQAELPVVFDTTTDNRGGNVLYLDGHVTFDRKLPNISLLLK